MKYKNITKKDLSLVGVGLVKAGEVFETEVKINNPNFPVTKEEIKPQIKEETKVEDNEQTKVENLSETNKDK